MNQRQNDTRNEKTKKNQALLDRAFERVIGSRLEKLSSMEKPKLSGREEELYRQSLAKDRESKSQKKRKTLSAEHVKLAGETGLSGQVVALMIGKGEYSSDDQDNDSNSVKRKRTKRKSKKSSKSEEKRRSSRSKRSKSKRSIESRHGKKRRKDRKDKEEKDYIDNSTSSSSSSISSNYRSDNDSDVNQRNSKRRHRGDKGKRREDRAQRHERKKRKKLLYRNEKSAISHTTKDLDS